MSIKRQQFKELLQHIVKEVLNEIDTITTDTTGMPTTPGVSPGMQAKMAREKKIADRKKLAADKKMLKKIENDEKSLKTTYDITRRITKPNLKKQIDAEKKAATLG